jgi:ferrochelatase
MRQNTTLTGYLLINTGTPAAPTRRAVQRYLARFLADRRIVNLPHWLWLPILHGIVLRARPHKTVGIYQRIWTPQGSPYTLHSQAIEHALGLVLPSGEVRMAHTYGSPSVKEALAGFAAAGIADIVVLPLYPQEAKAPTGGALDELERALAATAYTPQVNIIANYYQNTLYLEALTRHIAAYFSAAKAAAHPGAHLIFSFHSIPLKDERNGDPYREQARWTVAQLAERLELAPGSWSMAYQSRFDDAQRWAGPFLQREVTRLLKAGARQLYVVCPGFAVDCTETLYDVDVKTRAHFDAEVVRLGLDAAEYGFTYIPAMNEDPAHIDALADVLTKR